MNDAEFWHLMRVSDAGLRRGLSALLACDGRTEARIVAHLAEVDRRKLYLKDGYSALFNYCKGELGLSENQAFHRMTAAKIARRFPVVFGMLERRAIHLSGLVQLRDFLTEQNHRELLEWAAGKSKRQLEALLAARFPGPGAPDSVRKLPAGKVKGVSAAPGAGHSSAQRLATGAPSSAPSFEAPASTEETFDPVTGEVRSSALDLGGGVRPGLESGVAGRDAGRKSGQGARLESSRNAAEVCDARYRIQFDASSALKAKLELARALSSHSNPPGDLEILFGRALDAYVEQLQKRRFAQVERPRKSEPDPRRASERMVAGAALAKSVGVRPVVAATVAAGNAVARLGKAATAATTGPLRLRSSAPTERRWRGRRSERRKHVSHETRRLVVARDGLRCTFVAPNGHRCEERAFLQFDHQRLWSRGGSEEPGNLRMLCASHNRWLAEQVLGTSFVEQRIFESQTRPKKVSAPMARAHESAIHEDPR